MNYIGSIVYLHINMNMYINTLQTWLQAVLFDSIDIKITFG